MFKGNGFELNERLNIRKHSWRHKHTDACMTAASPLLFKSVTIDVCESGSALHR